MDEIVEGARAQFHLLPRPVQAHGASEPGHTPELGPLDVTCRLRTLGTGTWHEKKLDAVSWQHVGQAGERVGVDLWGLDDRHAVLAHVHGRASAVAGVAVLG